MAARSCWRLSRIGKVAAATTATTLIEAFGARRIVFTGVAGGLGRDVRVGDVVVAEPLRAARHGRLALFPRFEVPLYGQALLPAMPACPSAGAGLPQTRRGASSNTRARAVPPPACTRA
jgi:adenosylhomocysteine nucleosidase